MSRRVVGWLLLGYFVAATVVMMDFSDELEVFAASLRMENAFILLWVLAWFGSLIGGAALNIPSYAAPPYPPTLEDDE